MGTLVSRDIHVAPARGSCHNPGLTRLPRFRILAEKAGANVQVSPLVYPFCPLLAISASCTSSLPASLVIVVALSFGWGDRFGVAGAI